MGRKRKRHKGGHSNRPRPSQDAQDQVQGEFGRHDDMGKQRSTFLEWEDALRIRGEVVSLMGEPEKLAAYIDQAETTGKKMFAHMVVAGEEFHKKEGLSPDRTPHRTEVGPLEIEEQHVQRCSSAENKTLRNEFNKMKKPYFQFMAMYHEPELRAIGLDDSNLEKMRAGKSPDNTQFMVSHKQMNTASKNLSFAQRCNPYGYAMRLQSVEHASNDMGVDDATLALRPGQKASVYSLVHHGIVSGHKPDEFVRQAKPLVAKIRELERQHGQHRPYKPDLEQAQQQEGQRKWVNVERPSKILGTHSKQASQDNVR